MILNFLEFSTMIAYFVIGSKQVLRPSHTNLIKCWTRLRL